MKCLNESTARRPDGSDRMQSVFPETDRMEAIETFASERQKRPEEKRSRRLAQGSRWDAFRERVNTGT